MNENYALDTKKFTMDMFKRALMSKEILPGRIILKEKPEERFDLLRSLHINTLSDLLEALKTKQKIEKFSKETGLSVEYLTILRREANSYISSPVRLIELPFVETEIISKLEMQGMKDSKQFFQVAAGIKDRQKLSEKYQLSYQQLTELVCLCDLVRITGVGPVFARIIYDSGIRTVQDFLSFEAPDLLERLTATNNELRLTNSKFALKDIEYCLELGSGLPLVVEL